MDAVAPYPCLSSPFHPLYCPYLFSLHPAFSRHLVLMQLGFRCCLPLRSLNHGAEELVPAVAMVVSLLLMWLVFVPYAVARNSLLAAVRPSELPLEDL